MTPDSTLKTLSLLKGRDLFQIRYAPADAAMVIDQLIDWVHNPTLPFDWFDAAVMSHSLGQQIATPLHSLPH
jgi:hypothetical protein